MKKPTKPLRAHVRDADRLKKASGGRGTCHGYYECNFCHWQSWTPWDNCQACNRPWERINDGMGGPGSKK